MSDENFQTLLSKIKVQFNDPKILQTAFTHRSFLNEAKEAVSSNERLEFLGDSVLSFIVSTYLFKVRPNDEEGALTNLRSYIVKTKSLALVSEKLELGRYLRMSKGEEASGGRNNVQLLANTFESLLGAIFLDQGLEAAESLVFNFLLPDFETEIKLGPPKDAKSTLQEILQDSEKRINKANIIFKGKGLKPPIYRILNTIGPDHAKKFVVGVFVNGEKIGEGSGFSKQAAEEEAAAEALDQLTK